MDFYTRSEFNKANTTKGIIDRAKLRDGTEVRTTIVVWIQNLDSTIDSTYMIRLMAPHSNCFDFFHFVSLQPHKSVGYLIINFLPSSADALLKFFDDLHHKKVSKKGNEKSMKFRVKFSSTSQGLLNNINEYRKNIHCAVFQGPFRPELLYSRAIFNFFSPDYHDSSYVVHKRRLLDKTEWRLALVVMLPDYDPTLTQDEAFDMMPGSREDYTFFHLIAPRPFSSTAFITIGFAEPHGAAQRASRQGIIASRFDKQPCPLSPHKSNPRRVPTEQECKKPNLYVSDPTHSRVKFHPACHVDNTPNTTLLKLVYEYEQNKASSLFMGPFAPEVMFDECNVVDNKCFLSSRVKRPRHDSPRGFIPLTDTATASTHVYLPFPQHSLFDSYLPVPEAAAASPS
jgi:hypothetical protein